MMVPGCRSHATRWFALLLLAMAAMFAAPRADATTTCSVTSITNMAFGAVDPTGSFVDTQATVNYQCVYTGTLGALYGSYITACVSLGPDDLGNISPRSMINANSDRMVYQAYKDSGRTSIWGRVNDATYPPGGFVLQIGILSNGATVSGSIPIYGRVPALQSALSPGSYSGLLASSLAGNALTWSYNEALLSIGTYPTTCTAGGNVVAAQTVVAPSMTATATVAPKCTVGTATDLNFGSVPGLLNANTDQTSLLRVTCTNRAAYQIGLDNGQNASGTTRRMVGGGQYVTYELYREPSRNQRWGAALNTDTLPGTGTGVEQTLTVYGRVPVQTAVPAGSYSDVVMVTVTY